MFLAIISALILICRSNADENQPKVQELSRSGRKYDTYYRPPANFGDESDDADDTEDDDMPVTPAPPSVKKNHGYGNYKGFDYKPNISQFYKGYPFNPYWKGMQKGKGNAGDSGESDTPVVSPVKMMEMMMMVDAMKTLQDSEKDENKGLFPSLSPEIKQLLIASVIPLSIVIAAVVPVLVNYMMTGASLQLISTTASNKDGRSVDNANILDNILKNFEEIARSVGTDDCLQKTLCEVASRNSSTGFSEHMRKAASAVSGFVNTDWVKDVRIKNFVSGLKEGNCENVCTSSVPVPRNISLRK